MGLLAVMLAWTTLCLGGYRPETMVVTSALNAGLAALCCLLWAGGAGRLWNRAAAWPVPFLIYALANTLWVSPVGWLAWREWLLWAQMWLVFAAALHFGRSRAQTGMLAGTILTLAVVAAAMAAYQRFVDKEWLMLGRRQVEQFFGRASGPFGIPNSLAALLELVLLPCLAVALARGVGRGARVACGALAMLFGFTLVLSVSRGGMIGLSAALLLWPVLAGRTWPKRLQGAGVAVILMATAAVTLYSVVPSVRERLEPFLEGRWEPSRRVLWRAAWRIFREHPWLGGGAGSYNIVFERHRPAGFHDEPQWTHNDYLNTLSDYGAAGFALFAAGGAGLLWSAWRATERSTGAAIGPEELLATRPFKRGVFLGVVAFAVHLLVDFHMKIPALAFAVAAVLGLLLREPSQMPSGAPPGIRWRWGWLAMAATIGVLGAVEVVPVYRAEALRYGSRQAIDEYAACGKGRIASIVARAHDDLSRAVHIDPANAQAWADLSYVYSLQAFLDESKVAALGLQAERAAGRAMGISQMAPEFWVRLGVALDMQGRRAEAERCFAACLRLAPKASHYWYYYAHHLASEPADQASARAAIATCLELDPNNTAAVALREQLNGRR